MSAVDNCGGHHPSPCFQLLARVENQSAVPVVKPLEYTITLNGAKTPKNKFNILFMEGNKNNDIVFAKGISINEHLITHFV